MKDNLLTAKLFLRLQNTNKKGKAPIYLRFYYNGKKKEIHLKEYIEPWAWDEENEKVKLKAKSPKGKMMAISEAKNINERIASNKDRIVEIEEYLLAAGKEINVEVIYEYFEKHKDLDLIEFAEKMLEENKGNRYGSKETIRNHRSKLRVIKKFEEKIPFKIVNIHLIRSLDDWLIKQPNVSRNTANQKHKYLKSVINQAIKEGYLHNNPYRDFTIRDIEHAPKEFLTKKEVNLLYEIYEEGNLPGYLHNVLTFFLASCLLGVRHSDWDKLKNENIENEQLVFVPHKTREVSGKTLFLPLSKRSKKIINDITFRKIKPITQQNSNRYIKELMNIAEINKKISTHCGRHSFAIIGLNEFEWEMAEVSRLLGHAKIQTTINHYAKYKTSHLAKKMAMWDD